MVPLLRRLNRPRPSLTTTSPPLRHHLATPTLPHRPTSLSLRRHPIPTTPVARIVVEYMEYGSLQQWIDEHQHAMEEDWVAVIAYSVLSALNYLHKDSNIHRDVKPGNILISKSGQVKLSDFGITKEVNKDDPACSSFAGTQVRLRGRTRTH